MPENRVPRNYITRRDFIDRSLRATLAAGLSGSCFLAGCRRRNHVDKPTNIILISIDTLRADHLGCYGYGRPTSPALDKIASEGVLFEDISTTCPWTLPAHASLLTGLYPCRNGVRLRYNRLPGDVVTLAQILWQEDFSTSAVVNSHWLSEAYGLNRGFEDFTYVKEDVREVDPSRVGEEGMNWLSHHGGSGFFLFLHYYDVHSDYRSLAKYEEQFVRPYQGVADGSTAQLSDCRYGKLHLQQEDILHFIDLYDAGIRQMDDGIAQLFGFLEERGLLNNTLVIITADHGEEFIEHGGVLHGRTFFQEVIHVPLIFKGPGIPRGRRIRQIGSLVDVMPTILSRFDIRSGDLFDGIDLGVFWLGKKIEPAARFIFGEADWNNVIQGKTVDDIKRLVRYRRNKLHCNLYNSKLELYDLQNDPGEKTNIAGEHGTLVELLVQRMISLMSANKKATPAAPLTNEEIERLKSLGYIQ